MAQAAAASSRGRHHGARPRRPRLPRPAPARARPALPDDLAAGPPITSSGGHCHFLGGVVERGVRDAVREHAERGVDVIKVMASGGFLTSGTASTAGSSPPTTSRRWSTKRTGTAFRSPHTPTRSRRSSTGSRPGRRFGACSFADGRPVVDPRRPRRRISGAGRRGRDAWPSASARAERPTSRADAAPCRSRRTTRMWARCGAWSAGTDAGIDPVKPHGVLPHRLPSSSGSE